MYTVSHISKTVASTGIDFLKFTPTRNPDDVSPQISAGVYAVHTIGCASSGIEDAHPFRANHFAKVSLLVITCPA